MVDYSNIPRDSRRVPIAAKVQFKFDRFSGFISEYSANISPTGMFIVTENPEPAGKILDLEFRLGDGFEIIKGQAEVVWVRSLPDGPSRPPGMGIRFLELSPGSQDLIYRIVDRFVAQGGTPFDLTGTPSDPIGLRQPAPASPPVSSPPAAAPPAPEPLLPPLSLEPDPFPDLEGRDGGGTVLPWTQPPKETLMPGGDVLPPLEPLDEIFHLEEVPPAPAPPAAAPPPPAARTAPAPQGVLPFQAPAPPGLPAEPAGDPFAVPESDLDLTQAGPTVVGFDEPIPDPPSYPESRPSSSGALSGANDLFASYLPQPASPQEERQVRPLSTLAGGASVQQPRRILPLVLVAVLLAVAAAAFFLRDRITGWIGLGGGEEMVTAEQQRPQLPRPAAPPPADTTLHEEVGGLTSDASASTDVPPAQEPAPSAQAEPPAPAPVAPQTQPEPEPPLPEVVQRKPAPAPAAAGPAVTAVDRITYEPALGSTTVILWGNGAMRPESFKQIDVDSPPREVIQLRGIRRPYPQSRIQVGTPEVKQIRVGYHEKAGGNELHVVIDLASSRVRATRIEPDGQRLRIYLQAQ